MFSRIVGRNRQRQLHGCHLANCTFQLEPGNHLVTLGADNVDLSIKQFLFCIKNVENGPRSDRSFTLDTFKGNLASLDLGIERINSGPTGL